MPQITHIKRLSVSVPKGFNDGIFENTFEAWSIKCMNSLEIEKFFF